METLRGGLWMGLTDRIGGPASADTEYEATSVKRSRDARQAKNQRASSPPKRTSGEASDGEPRSQVIAT